MEFAEDHNDFFPLHFCAAGSVIAQKETGLLDPEIRLNIQKKYAIPRRGSAFLSGMLAAVDNMLLLYPAAKFTSRTALIVSSILGPQNMIFGFQDELMDYPEDQVMAGRFAQSVHNAPAGGLAIALGLTGSSYSVTGVERLFPESIRSAYSFLREGSCDSVLLISGEEKSSVSDALKPYSSDIASEERFCAFLITLADADAALNMQMIPGSPVELLQKLHINKELAICLKS